MADSGLEEPVGSCPSEKRSTTGGDEIAGRSHLLGLSVGEYMARRGTMSEAERMDEEAILGPLFLGGRPTGATPGRPNHPRSLGTSTRPASPGSTAPSTTRARATMDVEGSDDDASTEEGDATWEEYDGLLEDAATADTAADFLAAIADALDVADCLAVDDTSTQRLCDSLVTSVSLYYRKSRGLLRPPATRSKN